MSDIHFHAIDLNLLRLFDALAEERSVTRAGARLGLTQSAVSHALNRLRHVLQDELFVRGPDGMRPTARAEEIAPRLRHGLHQLQQALAPVTFTPADTQRRFTIADLMFPTFVFIMGVAVAFGASGRITIGANSPARPDWGQIIKRVAILFALGLMMNFDPSRLSFAHYRIPGVLQRIALSYLFCTILVTYTGKRAQAVAAAGLLALYWALMKLVPVPGFGAGDLSMQGNLVAFIDIHLIPGHLFKPVWDPEGMLSTIPAISTVRAPLTSMPVPVPKRDGRRPVSREWFR